MTTSSPQEYIDRRDRIRRQVNRRFDISGVSHGTLQVLVDAASCLLEDLECQDDLSGDEKYTKWALTHALDQIRWPLRYLWVEHNVRYVVGGNVEARFDPEIILGQKDGGWLEDDFLWNWDFDEEGPYMKENEMRFERGLDGEHGMPNPRRGNKEIAGGMFKNDNGALCPAIIDVPVVYDRCFMVTRMQDEEIMDMFKNYHTDHLEDVRHDQ